jgi:hypothetical protein
LKAKNIIILACLLFLIITGCQNSKTENKVIVEDMILGQSTYEEVKEVLPNLTFVKQYNSEGVVIRYVPILETDYIINNVEGKLTVYFDADSEKLTYVEFSPKDYSIKTGNILKEWLTDKYKDYNQSSTDTSLIFSNKSETIELQMIENPINSSLYYNIDIEWTLNE